MTSYVNTALSIPEIIERVREGTTVEERANILKRYDRRDLRWLVDFTFNGDKTGLYVPEYTPSALPASFSFMNINSAISKIEVALQYRDNLKVYERHMVLVLESISAQEAILLKSVIETGAIEGVSKRVFKHVYPEFFRQ